MSELYIALALIGTFGAVLMIGLAVRATIVDRHRAVEMLQNQVSEVTDMRQVELSQPFMERALVPFVNGLGRFTKRITPIGMRDRIARQLVLGGNTGGLNPEKVATMKVFGAAGGAALGFFVASISGAKPPIWIAAAVFMGLFGYLLPGAGIGQKAANRQEQIRRDLPDTMDLLSISVEAGLGFDAALSHVRRNVPGPLSDEIGRMMQEMQLGVPRAQAFRNLADRSDVEELKGFALAMVQADNFGISIASVLRAQSEELRVRRRQRGEEKAQKVSVKLLFPLILGFLPAMFIVIIGPGVIRLMESFFHIQF